jgi:15-cis-phytoene synthase/lycopene beta-cyclase
MRWLRLLRTLAVITLITLTIYLLTFIRPNIPASTQTAGACQLHYSKFHVLFTLPPLLLLYFLTAPFLTRLDWHKLYLLPAIAFVWTTPWDNELVRREAWWYPASCVLARIGYVPVEEYTFVSRNVFNSKDDRLMLSLLLKFIVQSLMTTLLTIFLTRWTTPGTGSISSNRVAAILIPLIPFSLVGMGLSTLQRHRNGMASLYYLSMITWWASMPLCLLWWGTAQSWMSLIKNGQFKVWILPIAISTYYLCCADMYALRRGTWHISVSAFVGNLRGNLRC